MTVSLRRLNRQTKGSVDRAMQHEAALTDVYAGQLARAAAHAADQFRQRAPIAMSAAVNPQTPDWVPPDVDELTTEPLDAQARAKARRIHLQALVAAAPEAVKELADELGIAFDINSPFVEQLLDKTAARAVSLTQETRDVMRKTIGQAYSEGWSVTQTADALQTQISGLSATTAVMQARTDLVGLGNGASLASASALGDAAPPTKVWLTAGDELVRPTHADAEGQEVPLDQPFQVGDDELAYPGDPDGSDSETINCRCSIVYGDGSGAGDELTAAAVQDRDGLERSLLPGNRRDVKTVLSPGGHGENDVGVVGLGDQVGPDEPDRVSGLVGGDLESVDGIPVVGDRPGLVSLGLVDEATAEDLMTSEDQAQIGVDEKHSRLVPVGAAVSAKSTDGDRSLTVDETGKVGEFLTSRHTTTDSSTLVTPQNVPPRPGSSAPPPEPLPSPVMGTDTESPDVLVAGATGDTGLKLSGRDDAWDADAAKKSLNPDDYPNAFFWRDPDGDPKTLAAYKLPFAHRTSDGLVAVWRGVTAAAQRLDATDIPSGDKDAVRAKIGKYYGKAAKQYDDSAIETPWAALVAAVTITLDDTDTEPDGDETMVAPVRWRGILCVEGEDSQDGPGLVRVLSPGGGTWRTPPLPLGVMFETPHAMDVPAPICGAIDSIYRSAENPAEIWGEGWINNDEIGCRAAELVSNLSLRGISIDPYVAEMDVLEPDQPVEAPEVMDGEVDTVQPTRLTFKRYVIGGATICPFQALESAQIAIVAGAGRPDEEPHVTTLSRIELVDPATEEDPVEEEALTAAAAHAAPPRDWFETQEPPGPMPLTVTDDGRVFGHLALWDSCHTGLEGACVRPPKSRSNYAYFHVGELDTADGSRLAIGKLMIAKPGRSGKHSSIQASRLEAARHYDDNLAIGAYIRVVDGRYGPWAAGCVRPGIDDDGLAQLKANPPSGDWRKVNGALDLIAALSVPVPGFPVPRADVAMVASGGLLELSALIASSGPLEASQFVLRALEREGVLPKPEQRLARPKAVA